MFCPPLFLRYVRLDGSTNPAQRSQNIDQFNEADSELRLFLCSTRAGTPTAHARAARQCRLARVAAGSRRADVPSPPSAS